MFMFVFVCVCVSVFVGGKWPMFVQVTMYVSMYTCACQIIMNAQGNMKLRNACSVSDNVQLDSLKLGP